MKYLLLLFSFNIAIACPSKECNQCVDDYKDCLEKIASIDRPAEIVKKKKLLCRQVFLDCKYEFCR